MKIEQAIRKTLNATDNALGRANKLNRDIGAAIAPHAGEINQHTAVGSWLLAALFTGAMMCEHHSRAQTDPNEVFAKNVAMEQALKRVTTEPRPGARPVYVRGGVQVVLPDIA